MVRNDDQKRRENRKIAYGRSWKKARFLEEVGRK
jgi:hypothetical protein